MGSSSETFAPFETYNLGKNASSTLSDRKKYKILKNHFKPDVNFNCLKKILHSCNRLCKTDYAPHEFVYSSSKDSVFCVYSVLFPDIQGNLRSSLMDKGYLQWPNMRKKIAIEQIHTIKRQSSKGWDLKGLRIQSLYKQTRPKIYTVGTLSGDFASSDRSYQSFQLFPLKY